MKKLLLLLLVFSVFASYAQVPSYFPTNGLVGYWPFNGNANDESGNGYNGSVNGATLTRDRFGIVGKAYDFSGSLDFATLPSATTSTITKTMSVSLWAKHNNPNSTGFIFDKAAVPGYYDKATLLQWGIDLRLYNENSFYNTFQNVQDTNWHQYVAIWKDTAVTLFIDGILKGTGILGNSFSNTPGIITLGKMNGYAPDNYSGKIDDIGIYNRALTQSEITGLYNAGTNTCLPSYLPTTGLVGYWPFCGNANDESGNGNNGTVNGATLTTDRFGNVNTAYNFNGINNHIIVNSSSTFNSLTQVSLSFWININFLPNTSQSDGFSGIITKWYGTPNCNSNSDHFGAWINNQSKIISGTSISPLAINMASSQGNITLNNWHHVVFSHNSLTGDFLYVNGVQVSQKLYLGDLCSTTNNIFIGCDNGLGVLNRFFNGKIDDIAIYNRALSATEIQNLYNSSAPTSCIANITNNDTTICRGQSLTLNADAVASGSVTDINGNVYPTVNIGSQTWMQKNLNVSKYKNGDIIPQVTDATQWANLTTGAWCWYNNDSATYAATYGKLYNGHAVNDPRGLAPQNWHIPTDAEWNKLVKFLDPIADTICLNCTQSATAGGTMKEAGTSHWLSPNSGATNNSGFLGLPGMLRYDYATFNERIGDYGFWWCSNESVNSMGFYRHLYSNGSIIDRASANLKHGFSVRVIQNTPTYLWSTGGTTPSITVSPIVTTTYYLTVTDANGNTCRDSVKVFVNTAIPSAPATLTGATDVCPNFSSATSATSNAVTYTAATVSTASSYTWTVPAGVTIVSGQGTNSITVTFANTFVSGTISVKANNACGSSSSARTLAVYKKVAATPGVIQKEFSPTSIAAVTNVTGLVSETYRIKKVTYATSYNWSLNRGTSATITHINPLGANDTAVIVTFANCFLRDTLSVKSVTPCSVSAARTAILVGYTTPAAVSGITTVGGNFATCIGVNKTFTAVRGTPTTSQAPIASFRWTRPANTSIVSATSDSASITVSFNTGYTGGSISAKGVSQCNVIGTTASSAILQFLPPGVLSIASSTGSYNACIGNSITYSALVSAPTTSQVAASVFRWTKPNNTTITSASADSSTITLQFNTGYIGGSLSVKGQTSCGTQGTAKTQSLTHAGCAAGTKMSVPVTTTETGSFEISLYPNPSAGEFKLFVGVTPTMATNLVGGKTPTKATKATVKIIDLQGRLIKSFQCNANQVTALGNELKPGVYMVEVKMGNEVKTVRAVRF